MGFFNKLFKRNVEGLVVPNQYYNPTTDDYELIQGSNGAAQVTLAGSNVIQPMDIQARYAQTIQTHSVVNIPAYDRSYSQWVDVSGFNEIEISAIGQGDIFDCYIEFSHDTNRVVMSDAYSYHHEGSQIDSEGGFSQKVKTRYVRIVIMNGSNSGVLVASSWLYLKC
jgi:hypothetical protein